MGGCAEAVAVWGFSSAALAFGTDIACTACVSFRGRRLGLDYFQGGGPDPQDYFLMSRAAGVAWATLAGAALSLRMAAVVGAGSAVVAVVMILDRACTPRSFVHEACEASSRKRSAMNRLEEAQLGGDVAFLEAAIDDYEAAIDEYVHLAHRLNDDHSDYEAAIDEAIHDRGRVVVARRELSNRRSIALTLHVTPADEGFVDLSVTNIGGDELAALCASTDATLAQVHTMFAANLCMAEGHLTLLLPEGRVLKRDADESLGKLLTGGALAGEPGDIVETDPLV